MDYQLVNAKLKEFIHQFNDGNTPILELVSEFCLKTGLPEDLVGDAISEDPELTRLIAWNMNTRHNSLLDNF